LRQGERTNGARKKRNEKILAMKAKQRLADLIEIGISRATVSRAYRKWREEKRDPGRNLQMRTEESERD